MCSMIVLTYFRYKHKYEEKIKHNANNIQSFVYDFYYNFDCFSQDIKKYHTLTYFFSSENFQSKVSCLINKSVKSLLADVHIKKVFYYFLINVFDCNLRCLFSYFYRIKLVG